MKIEVDLREVFMDEDGNEAQPSIQDAVIAAITDRMERSIERKIGREISDLVESIATKKVTDFIEAFIPTLLDYEITETSRYGETKPPITLRNRIMQDISREMVWRDGNFDSDKSVFTKVVKKVLEANLSAYRQELSKEIDKRFIADCMEYAAKNLRERIGIK